MTRAGSACYGTNTGHKKGVSTVLAVKLHCVIPDEGPTTTLKHVLSSHSKYT